MTWSEESILRWIARRPRPRILAGSPAHDAAVLREFGGHVVACCDQTLEGVHAERGLAAARLARKAVARTLSDLAATAAHPRAVLLAVSAPRETREASLRALIRAADETAQRHGAALVAGDLACAGSGLALTVTALGVLPRGRRAPGRDRARVGQLVLLTGPVGGSRLGRHLRPQPRFAEASFLFEHGATAMMDVSDGLARDAARLARASRVALELVHVPLHRDARRAARASGRPALDHALHDGEDHELLVTLSERDWERIAGRARRRFPGLAIVGRVHGGRGLRVPGGQGDASTGGRDDPAGSVAWDGRGGWVHGG